VLSAAGRSSRNPPVIIDHVVYFSLYIPFSSYEVTCKLSYALFGNSSLVAGIFRGRNARNVSKVKSMVFHFAHAHADTCVITILNNSRVFKNVIFKKLISTYTCYLQRNLFQCS